MSRVDFPTPDGPDSTKGLRISEAMVVEDIDDGLSVSESRMVGAKCDKM